MKIRLALIIFAFIYYLPINAQTWDWYKHFGNPATISDPTNQNLQISCVEIDNTKNIIIFGSFKDTLRIDGIKYVSSGLTDLFLAKYNSLGTLQWIRTFGGTDEDLSSDLALDANDNIYITGAFRGTTVFQTFNVTATNFRDIFITKINSSGNVQWLKNAVRGTQNQYGFGINVDNVGNIFLSGTFRTQAIFDNITLTVQKTTINNFIAKFDNSGTHLWSKQIIGTNANARIFEIEAVNSDEIYLGGYFTDTLIYESNRANGNSTVFEDIILMKINKDGNLLWMRVAGGTTEDRCNGLTSDIFGNIYLTGYITLNANFDSSGLGLKDATPLLSKGGYDMLVAKYNKNGTLQWKKSNGNVGNDIGYGAYTYENIVLFSGYFSDQVIFNTDTLKSSSTLNNDAGFFVYNTSGDPINGKAIYGNNADRGTCLTFDKTNSATYFGGTFTSDTLYIGNSYIKRSSINQEGFLAKYINPFSATFTKINELNCNGSSNGSLIVTPYFGVGPYSYSWSANVVSKTDSLAFNLPAGNYSVTVTDSRDSIASTSYVLGQPSAINLNAVATNVSCFPTDGISNNGSINLSVTGGTTTGGYTYNWEAILGSGVNATAEDQTTLTSGTYAVYVKDDNLCEASDTFTIVEPDKITFGLTLVTDETIPPGGNGAINLTVSGGNPAFGYLWTRAGGFTSISEDLTNIIGGAYKIEITDSKSCTTDTTFLVLNTTLLIAYITSTTDVDCKGANSGSASVGVINGTGPYTYVWKNNLGNVVNGDSPTLTNVPADFYRVKVTDNSNGKMDSTSVQIYEPALALSANVLVGNELLCSGDLNGVADLTVIGGTLPYSFLWSNNNTTEDLLNIGEGTYAVTVTDEHGCIVTDEVTLEGKTALDINIVEIDPILCNGDLSGTLSATATGGEGSKIYIWDDPGNQTEQTATSLEAGTYTVTATDQNGCSITDIYTLDEPDILSLAETHLDASCTGNADGIINLIPTGGTIAYNYAWSNGQISQDISNLAPNDYSVTVTDANNCIDSLSVTIVQAPPVIIQTIDITDASCFGYDDGGITITATGGSGVYQYSIDGGSNYNTGSAITGILADDYTVVVKDNTNCFSDDSLITVNQPAEIAFQNISLVAASCNGSTDGSIEITAGSGAGAPYQYSIDNGVTVTSTPLFSDLSSQSYHLRILDAAICQSADSVVIVTEPDEITFASEVVNSVSCFDSTNGSIQITVNGITTDFEYSIDNGSTYFDNSGIFTGLIPGTYQVRVRDQNSCEQSGSLLTVTEPELLLVDTTSINHALGEVNGSLVADATGGTSPFTFFLDPASDESLTNSDGNFTNLPPDDYTLYVIDNNSCQSNTLDISILQSSIEIIIFDAFSPNDDGVNDLWNIFNITLYPDCNVKVFNTWGNIVFSSDGYTEPWDGKYNDKLLPAGTYYFVIDLGDGTETYAGPVSIVQ